MLANKLTMQSWVCCGDRKMILFMGVAARRVVAFADDHNGLGCPTGLKAPIEIKRHSSASSNKKAPNILSQYMKPEHKRMSQMIGYCLTLGTPEGWADFCTVASVRLTPNERAAVAFAALNSLKPDEAEMTAAAAIGSAGAPLPPFLGGINEARFWASYANRSELKAYAIAAFEAMQAKDQGAFLSYVMGAKVA